MIARPRRVVPLAGPLATGGLITAAAICLVWLPMQPTWRLYVRTWLLAAEAALLAVPIGMLLAAVLLRMKFTGRRLLLLVVLAHLFFPLYLEATTWEAGFGRLGWYTVAATGVDRPLLSGWTAVLWVHVLGALPWVVVIVGVGLLTGNPHAEQSALLDARTWRVWWHVVLPPLTAWMGIAALWVAVTVATEMTVADLYQVGTYPREIYTGFALGLEFTQVVRRSLPALLLTGLLALWAFALAQARSPRGTASLHVELQKYRPGRWLVPLWLGIAALLVVLVGVPLGNLAYQAGVRQYDGATQQWSALQLLESLRSGVAEFRFEVYWTLLVSTSATMLVLPLSALLAAVMQNVRGNMFVLVLLAILVAMPGPLWGLGWTGLFNRLPPGPLDWLNRQTILAPVVAAAVRSLPWSTLLYWFALRAIPAEQFELARLEGATRWQRGWYIAAPQMLPATIAVAVVTLALGSGELAATLMVTPPAVTTVAIRLFTLIHAGVRDREATLALLQICWCTLLAGMLLWLIARFARGIEPVREPL